MPRFMAADTKAVVGDNAQAVKNRSLFADKYPEFPSNEKDKTARTRTLERLVGSGFDEGPACKARMEALADYSSDRPIRAKLGARMIVNHAGGVIENAGLALDRHSGVPYIPGSALKGIARAGACPEGLEALTDTQRREIAFVFGWAPNRGQDKDLPTELPFKAFAGSVAFLPAYPTGAAPLELDIVTVHHKDYYAGTKKVATDDESPTPNVFPVVKAGVEFQFVLAPAGAARGNAMKEMLGLPADFDPLARAREWLLAGITDHGIGSKTAAGYGWFEFDLEADQKAEAKARQARDEEERRREKEAAVAARLEAMTPLDRACEQIVSLASEPFALFAKTLGEKTPDEQQAFLQLLKTEPNKKDWWKMKKKKDTGLADAIRKVAVQHGVELS